MELDPNLPLAGTTILVVDDEPDTVNVFQLILETYGATVATARSISEGFRQAESLEPDAIITDYVLPDGLSSDLLNNLRSSSIPKIRQVPVISVTGATQLEEASISGEMLASGFQAFLAKPVEVEDLVRVISELISGASETGN